MVSGRSTVARGITCAVGATSEHVERVERLEGLQDLLQVGLHPVDFGIRERQSRQGRDVHHLLAVDHGDFGGANRAEL